MKTFCGFDLLERIALFKFVCIASFIVCFIVQWCDTYCVWSFTAFPQLSAIYLTVLLNLALKLTVYFIEASNPTFVSLSSDILLSSLSWICMSFGGRSLLINAWGGANGQQQMCHPGCEINTSFTQYWPSFTHLERTVVELSHHLLQVCFKWITRQNGASSVSCKRLWS